MVQSNQSKEINDICKSLIIKNKRFHMGYLEEATALKNECLKRHTEFNKEHRQTFGKDTNTCEEKKIDEWFSSELKKLQCKYKYKITP